MGISPTVKFNVGGKMFEVSRSLLSKFDDNMMLRVAADLSDIPNEPIFIERNGERFDYVLDYMRDGKVSLPFSISKESFISDLMFYGIDHVASNIIVRGTLLSHINSFLDNHSEQISEIDEHIKKLDEYIKIMDEQKKQWTYKKEWRHFAKHCLNGVMSGSGFQKHSSFFPEVFFASRSVVRIDAKINEETKKAIREIFEEYGFSDVNLSLWPQFLSAKAL